MTLGAGTFVPGGRFSFPRSYVPQFLVNVDTDTFVVALHACAFLDPNNHNFSFHIILDPRFYEWSSNKWTLDHVVLESYYVISPDPTEIPMPFVLSFHTYGAGAQALIFQPFGINFIENRKVPLPPPPSDYWTPGFREIPL